MVTILLKGLIYYHKKEKCLAASLLCFLLCLCRYKQSCKIKSVSKGSWRFYGTEMPIFYGHHILL